MQTFVFALIHYNKTRTWSADVPDWMRVPMKSRGEVAYVLDKLPAPDPAPTSICPYVFLEVTGVGDKVSKQKLIDVVRRTAETLADIDDQGGKSWRIDRRCDARVDFTRLPPAVRLAFLTPGASAQVTMEEFASACDLHEKGRGLQPADLA